jgi:hypothetical protein
LDLDNHFYLNNLTNKLALVSFISFLSEIKNIKQLQNLLLFSLSVFEFEIKKKSWFDYFFIIFLNTFAKFLENFFAQRFFVGRVF